MAPALAALNARIFTLALPRIPAISASIPGRFSQEIVSCFALGTGVPPAGGFEAHPIRGARRGQRELTVSPLVLHSGNRKRQFGKKVCQTTCFGQSNLANN